MGGHMYACNNSCWCMAKTITILLIKIINPPIKIIKNFKKDHDRQKWYLQKWKKIPVTTLTAESIPQAPWIFGSFCRTHRYILTEAFCRARPPSLWSNAEDNRGQRKRQCGAMRGELSNTGCGDYWNALLFTCMLGVRLGKIEHLSLLMFPFIILKSYKGYLFE